MFALDSNVKNLHEKTQFWMTIKHAYKMLLNNFL